MTNIEILEKTLSKAIANGFKEDTLLIADAWDDMDAADKTIVLGVLIKSNAYYCIIFNHLFAEALWGDGEPKILGDLSTPWYKYENLDGNQSLNILRRWEHHLQEMVIAEDPIKYLGENL